MSVRFILGRAGTGKTWHCLEQIEGLARREPLGPPIFWLLPRQATFQAERALTGWLGAFSRIRVVSFNELGKEVLADCGDVGIPEVTAMGRRMVLGHLLRQHEGELLFYAASARRPGLAAELDATFGEFERAGIDDPLLEKLVRGIGPQEDPSASLHDKLHDVHLLLRAYNAFIGQDRLDPQRRLQRVLDRVASCSLLKRATLFVDDFFDLTGYETRLLTAIAAAASRTEITLLIDPDSAVVRDPRHFPDELSNFHRTERTYRSLHRALTDAAATIEPPLVLRETRRFHSPEIARLEHDLFESSPPSPGTPGQGRGGGALHSKSPATAGTANRNTDVEFFDAPDTRTEVDAAARRIRRALRDGHRLRDIAVLVRDVDDYQELIDASFSEHDLPYFVDRRRTASHHPLLQFVRSALLIARHSWPHDAMMTLLKTGLAAVTEDQADELENYVIEHRIRGTMWISPKPWGFRRELTRADDADDPLPAALTETSQLDVVRRGVVDKLSIFVASVLSSEPPAVREIITHLFALLESFAVRRTLAVWMRDAEASGRLEQRGEHEQVWSELMQLLEHMVELLGSQSMTPADFLDVLDSGLESFDLALTPPTLDQVLVGQIERTRTPMVKLVIVLGLSEGHFPHVHHENCVLSDSERRVLRQRQIDLDPETERRLLDERFLAYHAFTRPSHTLVVSRPLADAGGRPSNPSPFWDELLRLFPAANVEHIVRPSQSDPRGIGTPRQLVTALMRWVRAGGDLLANDASRPSPWPALYQWFAVDAAPDDALAIMRKRAWPALSYSNDAELSRETVARLFPPPLHSTVARLETFAACPFKHFVRYGLKLQDREQPDVTGIDLSNAYHRVLENLIRYILQTKTDWCQMESSAAAELIATHAAEIGRTLRNELMHSNARNRYLLGYLQRTLEQAVKAMCEMHRRGKYRPGFGALRFGDGGKIPAHHVTTPAGRDLQLSGQIDRVDLQQGGSSFMVADYKLAASALALDHVFHGLSLQLLTHVLVVRAAGPQLTGRPLTPAAAFLMQLLRSPLKVDHPHDAHALAPDHPDFHLRVKPRGIIDARAIHSLDNAVTTGASAVVQLFIKKDGQPGNRNATDIADEAEFTALLDHVEKRLGELADGIVAGGVAVHPYWINRQTPCPRCDFRSVCRFEPGINDYHILPGMKREEVLTTLTHGGGHDH